MPRVGIRELKNQTTKVIRNVRENQAEYVITYHGRPVAVLLPVDEEWLEGETKRVIDDVRADLESLRQEISSSWRSEKTGVELVSEQLR